MARKRGAGQRRSGPRAAGRHAAPAPRPAGIDNHRGRRTPGRVHAGDTTVMKIDSRFSPRGPMGQTYLASGVRVAMRLWRAEAGDPKPVAARDYETVGFVLRGRAELISEGQTVLLRTGDSWVVPRGAAHTYRILEPLVAIEATSPPAPMHGREETPDDADARGQRGG